MLRDILRHIDLSSVLTLLLACLGGVLAWYRKHLKRWRQAWRDVFQGLRAIPDLQKDVQGIRYFVSPNGGGSLMDSAKRTETAVTALTEQMTLVVQTMWAENDSDDEIGRFHCNADGENTYVNQMYARWLGVGKTELMGWNYLNFVHDGDIDRVRQHWAACRAEHRQYRIQHRMVASTGEIITVSVTATPIPDVPPAKRWIGSIRKIENG